MKRLFWAIILLLLIPSQLWALHRPVLYGTVTNANMAVTLTAGSADIDLSSATDPRNYQGNYLVICDSSNVCISGFVYTNGAGTVQNIVSTKGGTTRNWATQAAGFNANDAGGYTYRIAKTQTLIQVSGFGGAVTASQEHASTVAGTAFHFSDALDFSPYQDGRYYIRLSDGTDVAWGKIKAETPAGESLDANVYLGFNFTSGWTSYEASIVDANTFTISVAGRGVYKSVSVISNALYKLLIDGSVSAGIFKLRHYGTGFDYANPTFGVSFYANSKGTNFLLAASAAATVDITTLEAQQVLTPPATGAIIVNANGDQSLISAGASFSPNGITSVTVYYGGN